MAGIVDSRLDDMRVILADRLRQIQADHREGLVESANLHLDQVRSIVDENLEDTLERRLGERFRLVSERPELVSERLEQVHRGLGEVQSFATGMSDLQRALVRVRLGGTRMAVALSVDGQAGARAQRRRRKTDVVAPAPAPTALPADAVMP